ncbi:MAG: hypothetical protein P8N92_07485 [Burkholderiales bacterium]|jgi:hypothetical protein|nr:hypothetical protein [Burkholderiales bacterium]
MKFLGLVLVVLAFNCHAMEYATVIDVVTITETRTSPTQVIDNEERVNGLSCHAVYFYLLSTQETVDDSAILTAFSDSKS